MTANDEMRRAVFLADIGQFENNPHHPGMDAPVLDTIAENGICLYRTASVKRPGRLSFRAPDTEATFNPNIRSDDFMNHINDFGMVNQQTGCARPERLDVPEATIQDCV